MGDSGDPGHGSLALAPSFADAVWSDDSRLRLRRSEVSCRSVSRFGTSRSRDRDAPMASNQCRADVAVGSLPQRRHAAAMAVISSAVASPWWVTRSMTALASKNEA